MKSLLALFLLAFTLLNIGCKGQSTSKENISISRAQQTLDSIYQYYGVADENLLRETYPFDESHKATYLASEDVKDAPNQFSYLWPYSGTLSATVALLEITKDDQYKTLLDNKVIPGLEQYLDTKRTPHGYSSYITTLESDRFYDDNVWLGIDFTDAYRLTGEQKYLDKAKLIWDFVWSGTDSELDGGIYWCEQKKGSKHTCSNAPGSVFALKMFEATQDSTYFEHGKFLYEWTKEKLQDSADYLYFDNIRLDASIAKEKYSYNSGQMLQAAVLLYNLTQNESYLTDAKAIAEACHNYFFEELTLDNGEKSKRIKNGDIWFTAVMLRGFIELHKVNEDNTYLSSFQGNLDYAWNNMRDEQGLFNKDWRGKEKDDKKWLLTQAAMVEMYARIASTSAY